MARPLRIRVLAAPLAFAFVVALGAAPAEALTLGFDCITGNDAGDCAIGEAQLKVEVVDLGGGEVRFHFRNAPGDASSITEVYFDDGSLLGLSSVIDGPGVDFEPDASPPDLPGGNLVTPPFQVTAGFLAEASSPPPLHGVNPGEWVIIQFDLQAGRTYADVVSELASGALRIGVRATGYASGGSESFVNQAAVPEPSLLLLLGAAAAAPFLRHRARM